jgi:hypothetical protein
VEPTGLSIGISSVKPKIDEIVKPKIDERYLCNKKCPQCDFF